MTEPLDDVREPVRRPAGVSLVVWLTYLSAFLDIVAGVWVILTRETLAAEAATTTGSLLVVGSAQILVGIFVGLLAAALGRGSRGSRMIVTFLMILRLGLGLFALVGLSNVNRWLGLAQAALAVLVLWLLWNRRASEFFARAY